MKLKLRQNVALAFGSVLLTIFLVDQLSPTLAFLKHWGPGETVNPGFERIYSLSEIPETIAFDRRKIPPTKITGPAENIPSSDKDYLHQMQCPSPLVTMGFQNPNVTCPVHLKRISNGATLFQGVYSTDELGRRLTLPRKKGANQVFALDGCSFTFGDTLANDETISSRLQHYLPSIRSLNLGVSGRAPNSSLYYGDKSHWLALSDAKGSSGFVAYLFVDFQVSRVMEDSTWMEVDRPHDPVYRMEKGRPVFQGPAMKYYSGLRGLLFWTYTHSKFFQTFHLEPPIYSTSEKMDLTAALIREDLNHMAAQLKSAKKLLLIHPFSLRYAEELKQRFDGSDVQVLDYSKYDFYNLLNGHIFTEEGHPSALVNDLLAALIANDVKKLN